MSQDPVPGNREAILRADHARRSEIREAFAPYPQFRDLCDQLADDPNVTPDAARFDEDAHEAAIDALLLRHNVPIKEPHPCAADFRRTSIVGFAEHYLRSAGRATAGMAPEQIAIEAMGTRAEHTTTDFPASLSGIVSKSVMAGYDE